MKSYKCPQCGLGDVWEDPDGFYVHRICGYKSICHYCGNNFKNKGLSKNGLVFCNIKCMDEFNYKLRKDNRNKNYYYENGLCCICGEQISGLRMSEHKRTCSSKCAKMARDTFYKPSGDQIRHNKLYSMLDERFLRRRK